MPASNFLKNVAGILTEEAPAITAAPNRVVATGAGGTLDPSLMPAGVGQDIEVVVASEALAAGALVNIWNNAGASNVRNASGAPGSFKPCHGFVLAAVASGANASVYRSGQNTQLSGLTPGAEYFLSTTSAGAVQVTAPISGSGYLSQKAGVAVSATVLDVQPQTPVQLI